MDKEYWLIEYKLPFGIVDCKVIDRLFAYSIREATKQFKARNEFVRIKTNLVITKSERWFE